MAKLGDIATIQSGGTPARSIAEYWEDGTIPWVKISDIKSKHLNQTEEMITEAGLENSSAKIFPKGTILYTIFATLGETSVYKGYKQDKIKTTTPEKPVISGLPGLSVTNALLFSLL